MRLRKVLFIVQGIRTRIAQLIVYLHNERPLHLYLVYRRHLREQLHYRLEDEFEIEERVAILDRKLELISRTV